MAGVVAVAKVEVAVIVVAKMVVVVLASPPTPHRPSATAPTHLVLKLTFPECKCGLFANGFRTGIEELERRMRRMSE